MKFWNDVKNAVAAKFGLTENATDAEIHQAVIDQSKGPDDTDGIGNGLHSAVPTPVAVVPTVAPIVAAAAVAPVVIAPVAAASSASDAVTKADFDALKLSHDTLKSDFEAFQSKVIASAKTGQKPTTGAVATPTAVKSTDAPYYLQNLKNAHLLEKWLSENAG